MPLTVAGLVANLAWLLIDVATRFALIQQWAEVAAYMLLGTVFWYVAICRALSQEAGRDA
ncbi:hypothetical protein [Streptosporangium sp. NPDC049078]|uniref:hypothetical protein n=1 Tax=Streptosporangium sp. NPDC049078 TaxID=3155767 RepID=UPI003423A86D